jgi:type I restriction-modification system DNA methylase subunit
MASYNILQNVGFICSDGKLTDGLVLVKGEIDNTLAVDEQAILYEAKFFKHIDYVFFRRFSDARSSQVAAYVVDNTQGELNDNTLSELHHQVWLQGITPLLYIAGASRIDILACARGPDFWNKNKRECQYKPAQKLNDTLTIAGQISDVMKKFSALRLADGTFWDDLDNRKLANYDKAAHKSLIQAVVDTDKNIDGDKNPLSRRLLILFVLIKYLEDREVFEDENIFDQFHKGAKRFLDVLQGNDPDEVNSLLLFLSKKFNGDVFDITKFNEGRLTKKILKDFTYFIEAKTINNQRYLWEQFSFKHLPVEIISHLYQRFVKGGHGTVYTPPFLASLLLDYIMPYNKITGEERILDPACGSGVFLVGAFKRLIYLLRSKNNWKNPTVNKLKGTLKKCIFGVDLDQNAIDLTAFSLSLAICDALKPKVIWNELKFDYLRDSNLFETDFFDLLLDSRSGNENILNDKFDIVIGNPPFESELSTSAKKIDDDAKKNNPARGNCPDNNIAYLFLEQTLNLLREKSHGVCMIQPQGFIYNRNVDSFRTEFVKKYFVEIVFDFVSIRKLYESADTKTVAIMAKDYSTKTRPKIKHWTFRRTVCSKEKICFELDNYDQHYINQKQAENNPYIWKANLLGGGRFVDVSQRLSEIRTLLQYLENKIKDNCWDYGEGFVAAKTGKREPAPFLTGKPYLPSNALNESGTDRNKIIKVKETLFRSAYTEDRYTGPLMLIRALESLQTDFLEKGFLAYSQRIIGIHAPKNQKPELLKLFRFFKENQNTYRFCCALLGQAFLGKATSISKQDIDLLPYPENPTELLLSFWEKVLSEDVLKYMAEYIRRGQNSKLLTKDAKSKDLQDYSNTFIKMLGSIYRNLKASDPVFLNGLICQPFYFGEKPELDWLDENAEEGLEKLIYSTDEYKHLRTIRVVRFYDKNVFIIIKPDRLRYWIRSTAIRDADETLQHLYDQGY